jgi:hypothetical protein
MLFGENYSPITGRTRETTFVTFSQTQLFAEIAAGHHGPEIPVPTRAYFQQRFRNRIFKFILEKFATAQQDGLTQAILARRIGRSPEVVNRWLGMPSNLTVDSISDLVLGIAGEEIHPSSVSPLQQAASNYSHFDDLASQDIGAARRAVESPKTQLELGGAFASQTYKDSNIVGSSVDAAT